MKTLRTFGGFHLTCALLVVLACASGVLCTIGRAWGAGGDLLWQVATGGALAASHGRVVVAGSAGVQTFDGDTGSFLWQDSFVGATRVAMDAQQVIAVGANAIRAYDSRNGAMDWQGPLASGTVVRAVVLRGNQFLITGFTMGPTGEAQMLVRAYNARTGEIEWEDQSVPVGRSLATISQKAISVHGNRAYVVSTLDPRGPVVCLVRAYDRERGQLVWESVSQEPCLARAVAAHGKQVILAAIGGVATALAKQGSWLTDSHTSCPRSRS